MSDPARRNVEKDDLPRLLLAILGSITLLLWTASHLPRTLLLTAATSTMLLMAFHRQSALAPAQNLAQVSVFQPLYSQHCHYPGATSPLAATIQPLLLRMLKPKLSRRLRTLEEVPGNHPVPPQLTRSSVTSSLARRKYA